MVASPASSGGAGFLSGEAEMARLIRVFDWGSNPLGPPEHWRPTLKAMVRMMLTTQHPVFIFWGPDHICLYNDAYRASIGPEKHPSMLGARGVETWPEVWHIIGPQIEMVLRGDGATWHENQLVPIIRHGQLSDVYWTYSYGPIDDETAPNGIGGVLVLCTETTQQVLSERRLKLERENFVALFEQAPTFMALLRGPDHVVELANPRYMRLVGHRPVIGKSVAEALPEAAEQGYLALLDQVYRSGQAFSAVGSKYHVPPEADGSIEQRYLDFVYQPIKDVQGQVSGIFVEGVDVTERRATEQALRLSEDRFRLAVESSNLGTFEANLTKGEVALSAKSLEIFDLQGERQSFEACVARMHPADVDRVKHALDETRQGRHGGAYRLRHRIVRGDGQVRHVDVSGQVVFEDAGSKGVEQRLIGVIWDETEIQAMMDALQDADRRKDEFLATLAHELRNPLAALRSGAHLLSRPELSPDRLAWCRELIERQAKTMGVLLDDLLEASRISTGKLELRRQVVTLTSVVDSALEMSRPLLDEKRHALEVSMPPDTTTLEVDPLRAAQILTNLLTNAAKYTDPGGHIALEAQVRGDQIRISVTDNGIGVTPESLPLLFEMFHQVHGPLERERGQGGLGIGLAVARALVDLHGGCIEASSAGLGKGSVFRVTLPIGASHPVEAAHPAQAGNARAGRSHRVLVADDNVDAAQALAAILELDGYEVVVVHDGVHAFDEAAESKALAAFLDIGMPGLDGYQLAAKLRTQPWGRNMLLVAITGWGQEADKQRAFDAGFDAHLTKPFDPAAVERLMAERTRTMGEPVA